MSKTSDAILSELINEGERLVGPVPIANSNSSAERINAPPSTNKFDETMVVCVLVSIGIFIALRVFFKRWFEKQDEFGDVVFNTKKYVGVSALLSLVVSAGIWYYQKIYVKRGVSFLT